MKVERPGGRGGDELRARFARHLRRRALLADGDRAVVAVSGGLDSCVLLHLLRFAPHLPRLELTVAHFDHGMRAESGADADWVRGLARAWNLPVEVGRAERAPASEAAARQARYRFLAGVRRSRGARWLLTAHHADDQAETVLFRILRGTGVKGLAGIPERGPAGLLRPLLPFRRAQLEAYAERWRVSARPDPSNLDPAFARNVIRHELLPRAESAVARGASRSLLRLARLARRDEEAWRSIVPALLEEVLVGGRTLEGATLDRLPLGRPVLEGAAPVDAGEGPRLVLDRGAFLSHHPGVRARLLREAVRRLGAGLDETGTHAALEFTSSAASGRRHLLPGGLILTREFDRLVLSRPRTAGADEFLEITEPGEGRGILAVGGRIYRAEWTRSERLQGPWVQTFATGRLTFPLRLRGWAPGDRLRMPYGSKKLKKLFAEARVPLGERSRRPVLADARGAVLWVPGLVRSAEPPGPAPGPVPGPTSGPTSGAEARLTIAVTEKRPE